MENMQVQENRQDSDRSTNAIRMIIGAGDAIEFAPRRVDGSEFGLRLEDLTNIVDRRLSLRCLLPLPGIYRDRDGSIVKDGEPGTEDFESLKHSLSILEDAGWQTRLVLGKLLASSLTVDDNAVIFYEYLNMPPGPFFSTDPKEVAHYRIRFKYAWVRAFEASATEALYNQAKSFLRPPKNENIAILSNEAWTQLINRLSSNPRLLYELPPRKFEELIAELLNRDGLEVHLTPTTRDGGRDVLAFHQTPIGRLLYLVECKRFDPGRPVGIAIVQRLYGVVVHDRATAGLVVTTSRFSKESLTFGKTVQHQLGLRDYDALKEWLAKYGAV